MTSAQLCSVRYDVASAIGQGKRDYQEDALATDFPIGAPVGFSVLADGMGGHAAGDVASKIIVTEVFSELKLQRGTPEELAATVPSVLREAVLGANACVRGHMQANPDTDGMGATLLTTVLIEHQLFWISVGDSPLYLYRDDGLEQLNEDHSMAPQIDFMVRSGMMQPDVGKTHPDRNCLTSVLFGEDIPRIDCPTEPMEMADGDILIAASDGLQYLDDAQIAEVLATCKDAGSAEIAEALLDAVTALADPDQDNVSLTVIKINRSGQTAETGDTKTNGVRIWPWPRNTDEPATSEQPDKVASA